MKSYTDMLEELKQSGVTITKGFSQGRPMFKAMLDGQEIDRNRNAQELVSNVYKQFQ